MEGDVSSILSRPTLPPNSPDLSSTTNTTALTRYASKDLRAREAQAEIEKWDAWHECEGMSRTEAKRRYISTLIDTMKVYASSTPESRELIGELEFVWSQIRSQSGSSEDEENNGHGSGGSGDRDSPTRRLERAGMKPIEPYSGTRTDHQRTTSSSALRVLSPVSQGDIVEGEEVREDNDGEDPNAHQPTEDNEQGIRAASSHRRPSPHTPSRTTNPNTTPWQSTIETALTKITTELAALREQLDILSTSDPYILSSSHGLSRRRSSIFPFPIPTSRKGLWVFLKYLVRGVVRQLFLQLVMLSAVIIWGRWRGDRRVELWVKRICTELLERRKKITLDAGKNGNGGVLKKLAGLRMS